MKKFIYVLLALYVNTAYAVQTGSGTVKTLQSAYGGWIFSINHTNNNPSSCSKSTMILSGHSQQDQIFSLILSASIAGKPVIVFTNGCDANGYNIVSAIYTNWNPS